ncbi:hypothetical protein FN846DRAFT_966148 [Sphaerosporella brunnea]|uniref:Uncharacterized protein n=1 Tax=Sphaerosporella brunnea TaxID=1250544 RepID=A0A5J5EM65_9PEZI|nr:hypothetical protein FN846DRAFT_966148 [Sphaerosporella brunnea]
MVQPAARLGICLHESARFQYSICSTSTCHYMLYLGITGPKVYESKAQYQAILCSRACFLQRVSFQSSRGFGPFSFHSSTLVVTIQLLCARTRPPGYIKAGLLLSSSFLITLLIASKFHRISKILKNSASIFASFDFFASSRTTPRQCLTITLTPGPPTLATWRKTRRSKKMRRT